MEHALKLTGFEYNRPGILLQLILHPVPHRRRWPALWPPCAWITIRWKSKTSTSPAIRCWTKGARKPLLGWRLARRAARISKATRGAVVRRTADDREKQLRRVRKKKVKEDNLWNEWTPELHQSRSWMLVRRGDINVSSASSLFKGF